MAWRHGCTWPACGRAGSAGTRSPSLYELRSLSGPQLCRPCTVGAAQLSSPLTILLGDVVGRDSRRRRRSRSFLRAGRERWRSWPFPPRAPQRSACPTCSASTTRRPVSCCPPTRWLRCRPPSPSTGSPDASPAGCAAPALAVIVAAVVANLVVQGVALQRQSDVPYPATAAADQPVPTWTSTAPASSRANTPRRSRTGWDARQRRCAASVRLARRADVAYLTAGQAPSALAAWQRHALPHPGDTSAWYAYLPPSTATSP